MLICVRGKNYNNQETQKEGSVITGVYWWGGGVNLIDKPQGPPVQVASNSGNAGSALTIKDSSPIGRR